MNEPSLLDFALLITVSLGMALWGAIPDGEFYEVVSQLHCEHYAPQECRRLAYHFLINGSMAPISGGFFYTLAKYGWFGTIMSHLFSTTIATVIGFNLVWAIAESERLKRMTFVRQKLILFFTLIILTLLINVPLGYYWFDKNLKFVNYTIISSIYVGGAIGIVHALVSYMNLERKRKFDEKELELTRLRELKVKAELDALHSKVNPHFLYNALNSIADLSITDGYKARKMTIALADLFRYSINYSDNNFSTVREEIEMAEVYLQIEKIRFEDQLNYSVSVDPSLHHYLVPRFVLQPLVENAVKHGLKATGKLTEIQLDVSRLNDRLILTIADTGPGFPTELSPGYGVKSVYDKLDLLFPGQYEIHFANEPRKQVSLHILKLTKNESPA